MHPIVIILGGLAALEGVQQTTELNERHKVFNQAREHSNSLGLPLLVVGTPKHGFSHPEGDVTIDNDPAKQGHGNTELADVRNIPYPSGYFGAAYASHILEHLPTVDDACIALDELKRVAGKVFVVSPHKSSLIAWVYPGHHLWITPSDDGFTIEQRGNPGLAPREQSYIISLSVI